MARRKRTTKLRPKSPARIRKRKRAKSGRAHAHRTELWGLALVALGVFLGALLYLGWNGGVVGGAITDAITTAIGDAGYVLPVALFVLGGLMVARSALVDVRPFRTGLVVSAFGLLLTLGATTAAGSAASSTASSRPCSARPARRSSE